MNSTKLSITLIFVSVIVFGLVKNCSEHGLIFGVLSVLSALVVLTILVMLIDHLIKRISQWVKYIQRLLSQNAAE
jgi:hypothetical protein